MSASRSIVRRWYVAATAILIGAVLALMLLGQPGNVLRPQPEIAPTLIQAKVDAQPGVQATPIQPASAPAAPTPAEDPIARTLDSLRQIDDHPLYTMTYYGAYTTPSRAVRRPLDKGTEPAQWACSLFVAFADAEHALYGRNFDWYANPALLLFTHPPDGYASVAMVDMHYLGFDRDNLDALEDEQQRRRLLEAPLLPFDGMNEHGLAVGMAAVDESKFPHDPNKRTVDSLQIIRLMLDHARTTEEAITLFQQYNIDFAGGPPIHYLIADPSGHSAVVELKDGAVQIIRNDQPWQAATNFYLAGADEMAKQQDQRYRSASTGLAASGGSLSWKAAMDLLEQVAQAHTRWSIVYGMGTGEIHIATSRRYDQVHTFQLPIKREG